MVDAWESLQDEYQRTAVVLDHFNEEINGGPSGGVQLSDGTRKKVKIMLLAGGDLIQSMGEPGVWAEQDVSIVPRFHSGDRSWLVQCSRPSTTPSTLYPRRKLHHILGRYGCLIVERTGADVWSFLLGHDLLWRYRRQTIVVKQTIYNDISSSKVRLFIRRGLSIKYLLPFSVIKYIEDNKLVSCPHSFTALIEWKLTEC